MLIRLVKAADIPQIARLYYETVHRVNSGDHSPEQIRAWAPRIYPNVYWQRRFQCYRVFVAEEGGLVVGFAELERGGAIDCFYVHHARQHRGIGTALMARIERDARCRGVSRLQADVSTTAEPFFRHVGFRVLKRQKTIYRNRAFKQAVMEKRLGPGATRGSHPQIPRIQPSSPAMRRSATAPPTRASSPWTRSPGRPPLSRSCG